MPIVNYVREHIRFMEYAADEHVTACERLLWYALMHIMNQRAQGRVWPDEFIRISNDRLLTLCPMKYDTLSAARNSLKQRGLIEYVKGDKNKVSPAYRMIYFFPEYVAPETEKDGESYPEISDYMGGYMGGNMGGNAGGNMGDYSINYTRDKEKRYKEDNEEDDIRARTRAAMEEAAAAAWRGAFGKDIWLAARENLAQRALMMGFSPEMLRRAILTAAEKGGIGSPVDYIIALLADWDDHGVKTVDAAERYAYARAAARGKVDLVSAEEGAEMMEQFRKEREG